jgi:hypothetical protein
MSLVDTIMETAPATSEDVENDSGRNVGILAIYPYFPRYYVSRPTQTRLQALGTLCITWGFMAPIPARWAWCAVAARCRARR